jgi:4-hydroxy-4-methyl-2-oxoglutarate aldolase
MTDDGGRVEIADRFTKLDAGHVCDALEHVGILTPVLSSSFHPLTKTAKFAGEAAVLKLARSRTGEESRGLSEFIATQIRPGTAVVIDAQGVPDAAIFGDRAGWKAQNSGATGVVLNGAARDVEGLNELGLPVHATARGLPASEGRLQALDVNVSVVFDGVLINAGDWIVGDEAGICVVPADLLDRVLPLAEERQQIDDESFDLLRAGVTGPDTHRHFKDDDADQLRRLE